MPGSQQDSRLSGPEWLQQLRGGKTASGYRAATSCSSEHRETGNDSLGIYLVTFQGIRAPCRHHCGCSRGCRKQQAPARLSPCVTMVTSWKRHTRLLPGRFTDAAQSQHFASAPVPTSVPGSYSSVAISGILSFCTGHRESYGTTCNLWGLVPLGGVRAVNSLHSAE